MKWCYLLSLTRKLVLVDRKLIRKVIGKLSLLRMPSAHTYVCTIFRRFILNCTLQRCRIESLWQLRTFLTQPIEGMCYDTYFRIEYVKGKEMIHACASFYGHCVVFEEKTHFITILKYSTFYSNLLEYSRLYSKNLIRCIYVMHFQTISHQQVFIQHLQSTVKWLAQLVLI